MGSPSVIAQRASLVYNTAVDSGDIRLTSWQMGVPLFCHIFRQMTTQIYRKLEFEGGLKNEAPFDSSNTDEFVVSRLW